MKCNAKAIGRILIGLMFAIFGIMKVMNFAGTAGYIASAGIPLSQVVAVITIIIELGGGILLVVGKFQKYAFPTLTAWMILLTIVMHRNIGDQMQLSAAMKNALIIGGLLGFCSCASCSGSEHGEQESKGGCCGGSCHS